MSKNILLTTLCVVIGGRPSRCKAYKHLFILTISSFVRSSAELGNRPLLHDQELKYYKRILQMVIYIYFRDVSNIRFPTSCCILLIVSRSCFVTACPRNDSTLKLFVFVGKIRNATTVTSGSSD